MGRDFVIPGVDPTEHDPYRFHTGRKREHGGTDAIEIIDLVKQFGRARILNGLNLGLPEDQVSMVLGPSGTGKSVLIKHIVGLLYPDSGDVLVHGESIPNMTDDELFEVRKKFGLLFQDGALFGSMNIYDNVAFPLRQHTDKGEEEIGEIVNRRLKEVGLAEATYKMPNELSGGMRKRAGFARALVLEPAIVMFDEPDSGLDPVRTALLCELIREVHAENGGCYLHHGRRYGDLAGHRREPRKGDVGVVVVRVGRLARQAGVGDHPPEISGADGALLGGSHADEAHPTPTSEPIPARS